MSLYTEQTNTSRKEPKPLFTNPTLWEIVEDIPIESLNEYEANGTLVDSIDGLSSHYGVASYLDGSVSAGFHLETGDVQFFDTEKRDVLHSRLQSILQTLLSYEHVQFLWQSLDEDENTLNLFEADRHGLETHPVQAFCRKEILKRDLKRLQCGELKSFRCAVFLNLPYETPDQPTQGNDSNPQSHTPQRTTNSFLSVFKSLFGGIQNVSDFVAGLADLWQGKKLPSINPGHLHERCLQVLQRIQSFQRLFSSLPSVQTRPLNSTEYFRILVRTWSPNLWATDKLLKGKTLKGLYGDPLYALGSYVANEPVDSRYPHQFKTGQHYHRIFALHHPPEQADIGYVIGAMVAHDNSFIYNSQFSLTLRPTSPRVAYDDLERKLKILHAQYKENPTLNAALEDIIVDMRNQQKRLSNLNGSFCYQTILMVHLWHQNLETLDQWERSILSAFAEMPMNARLVCEEFSHLNYFINFFTPGYTRSTNTDREITYDAKQVATHLPLMTSTQGYISPKRSARRTPNLLETDRGTLLLQDYFADQLVANPHSITIGPSGSGKSMFTNLQIITTLSNKDRVIILDAAAAGGTYRALCSLLNGQYNDTGLSQNTITRNPLHTEILEDGSFRAPTKDEVQRFTNSIEAMVRRNPTQPLDAAFRSIIQGAIHLAFENFRENGRVYPRNIARALKVIADRDKSSLSREAGNMALHLENTWCQPNGIYRDYVDGDSSHLSNNKLIVHDLKGYNNDATLRAVMVAAYVTEINTIADSNQKLPAEQRARLFIKFDEAWRALSDPNMVQLIEELNRTGRARGMAIEHITQFVHDLKKMVVLTNRATGDSQLGENNAILGSTSWFNLFKCSAEDARVIRDLTGISDELAQTITELKSSSKYREMVQIARLLNGTAFEKLRIRPTPFQKMAFSSDPHDEGLKLSKRQAILTQWEETTNRRAFRQKQIDRLEELGFEDAASLGDHQILDLLAIIDSI